MPDTIIAVDETLQDALTKAMHAEAALLAVWDKVVSDTPARTLRSAVTTTFYAAHGAYANPTPNTHRKFARAAHEAHRAAGTCTPVYTTRDAAELWSELVDLCEMTHEAARKLVADERTSVAAAKAATRTRK